MAVALPWHTLPPFMSRSIGTPESQIARRSIIPMDPGTNDEKVAEKLDRVDKNKALPVHPECILV